MAHLSAVDHCPQVKTEESHNQTDLRFTVFNKQDRPYCTPLGPCFNVGPCEKPSDQFVIRSGNQFTLVLQNRPARPYRALPVFPIHTPLGQNVQWSPLGSYLLAINVMDLLKIYGRGVGGQGFLYVMRYYHPMVQQADFSPGEKYLVTYSKPHGSDPKSLCLNFFNVKTGIVIVGLERNQVADGESVKIRWSGGKDDKYFATLHQNTASVYDTETETFSMFGRFNDVMDLSWSPSNSILALLKGDCKRKQKQATKVVLLQIPSKEVLMEKDIGSDCEMYWQSEGKYLAVKVDEQHVFELFCFNEKGITNVCLKLARILAFSWEPRGDRFAVIQEGDQSTRDVSFYAMENGKASLQTCYQNKQVHSLFWSPRGKHLVLADFTGCCLEFLDLDKNRHALVENLQPSDIAWDPTGRYVATSVTISDQISQRRKRGIDGFKMWSSTGEFLYWFPSTDYCLLQLSWRPYGGDIPDDMLVDEDSKDDDFFWPSEGAEESEEESKGAEESEEESQEESEQESEKESKWLVV